MSFWTSARTISCLPSNRSLHMQWLVHNSNRSLHMRWLVPVIPRFIFHSTFQLEKWGRKGGEMKQAMSSNALSMSASPILIERTKSQPVSLIGNWKKQEFVFFFIGQVFVFYISIKNKKNNNNYRQNKREREGNTLYVNMISLHDQITSFGMSTLGSIECTLVCWFRSFCVLFLFFVLQTVCLRSCLGWCVWGHIHWMGK